MMPIPMSRMRSTAGSPPSYRTRNAAAQGYNTLKTLKWRNTTILEDDNNLEELNLEDENTSGR